MAYATKKKRMEKGNCSQQKIQKTKRLFKKRLKNKQNKMKIFLKAQKNGAFQKNKKQGAQKQKKVPFACHQVPKKSFRCFSLKKQTSALVFL